MHFDLILTARDRKEETLRFFRSLAEQGGAVKVCVLFADQGLGLDLEVQNLIAQQENVSLYSRKIKPSALSSARNLALGIGLRSDIVGFPDDDCWYDTSVLSAIQSIFDQNPTVQCVCTNVYDPIRKLSYGRRPTGGRRSVNFSNIFELPISVGIFVRRVSFEAVGPVFDETLGAGTNLGSGEETELIARLLEYGAEILYVGDISVYHPVPKYGCSDPRKYHTYALGYGYLATKLILRGHTIVLLDLIFTSFRSLAGFALSIQSRIDRAVYRQRLSGIVSGALRAIHDLRAGLI